MRIFLLFIQFSLASYSTREHEPEEFLTAEAILAKKLLKNYNLNVRPSKDGSGEPTEVSMILNLMMILEFWIYN